MRGDDFPEIQEVAQKLFSDYQNSTDLRYGIKGALGFVLEGLGGDLYQKAISLSLLSTETLEGIFEYLRKFFDLLKNINPGTDPLMQSCKTWGFLNLSEECFYHTVLTLVNSSFSELRSECLKKLEEIKNSQESLRTQTFFLFDEEKADSKIQFLHKKISELTSGALSEQAPTSITEAELLKECSKPFSLTTKDLIESLPTLRHPLEERNQKLLNAITEGLETGATSETNLKRIAAFGNRLVGNDEETARSDWGKLKSFLVEDLNGYHADTLKEISKKHSKCEITKRVLGLIFEEIQSGESPIDENKRFEYLLETYYNLGVLNQENVEQCKEFPALKARIIAADIDIDGMTALLNQDAGLIQAEIKGKVAVYNSLVEKYKTLNEQKKVDAQISSRLREFSDQEKLINECIGRVREQLKEIKFIEPKTLAIKIYTPSEASLEKASPKLKEQYQQATESYQAKSQELQQLKEQVTQHNSFVDKFTKLEEGVVQLKPLTSLTEDQADANRSLFLELCSPEFLINCPIESPYNLLWDKQAELKELVKLITTNSTNLTNYFEKFKTNAVSPLLEQLETERKNLIAIKESTSWSTSATVRIALVNTEKNYSNWSNSCQEILDEKPTTVGSLKEVTDKFKKIKTEIGEALSKTQVDLSEENTTLLQKSSENVTSFFLWIKASLCRLFRSATIPDPTPPRKRVLTALSNNTLWKKPRTEPDPADFPTSPLTQPSTQ